MAVRYVRFDQGFVSVEMAWLLKACRAMGWKGGLNGHRGGARTYAEQKALWNAYLAGKGSPAYNPDAPDPKHLHRHQRSNIAALGGWSCAADVSLPLQLIAVAAKLGVVLHRPYNPPESWHVEAKFPFKVGGPKPAKKKVWTPRELLLGVKLRRAGIKFPLYTVRAAAHVGLPLEIACAMLEQETGGGRNVFGHDPTSSIPDAWKGSLVTPQRYTYYKQHRGPTGGGGMQGVGCTQLTWFSYQDQADKLGGCWLPYPNMLIGFGMLGNSIRMHGLWAGVALYNGTGPAAHHYAQHVVGVLIPKWKRIIG